MTRSSFVLIAALVCGPLPFGPAPALGAAETEEALISRGVGLRKTGNDQEAREMFRKAYDRFHTPRSAAQLGLAEQALGRWEDAETHMGEALRFEDDPWIKKNLEPLKQAMTVIKSHIARVEVFGEPEGAEVLVNGRAVGRLPLPAAVSVSAGEVDVEARAPGFKREVRKLTLVGGQYQRLGLRLEKEAAASPPGEAVGRTSPSATSVGQAASPDGAEVDAKGADPAAATASDGDGPSPLRQAAKWTSLGLAGVGVVVGVTSTLVRMSKLNEFKSAHGGGCVDAGGRAVDVNGVPVPECQGPLNAYASARTWQLVGFVSAGVFAATWLVLLLTEPSAPPASRSNHAASAKRSAICGLTGDLRGATCAFEF
jgi:hypothetical protein